MDPATGAVLEEIGSEQLINEFGDIPDLVLNSSIPNVVVPKNSLEYGMYCFHLNVSMDKEIQIETLDSVCIEIGKFMISLTKYVWIQ